MNKMQRLNEMQRYSINIICDKIKRCINERGVQDKIGLITYDFVDISVMCVRGGNILFTINVSNDEESGFIFNKSDWQHFDFTYNGIEKCVDFAEMYINWDWEYNL